MIYSIDFETRSAIDLPDRGLDIYANDSTTEVLCIAWGKSPDSVQVAGVQNQDKNQLPNMMGLSLMLNHVRNGGKIQAWNAMFEYAIWNCVCVPKYGWPPLKLEQCIDSMAIAAANNIPQSLEEAALFLNASHKKDTTGRKLIQKLCKPKKDGTFNNDPEAMAELFAYCAQDVRAEMSISSQLRPLSQQEQIVWVNTQRINTKGIPLDPNELHNAIAGVIKAQDALDNECLKLTGIKPSERAQLLAWLNARGADMTDMTASSVSNKLVDTNLDPIIRRVLELRQLGSSTSVAKYAKMWEMQRDGRIRNSMVYHGASTGRWAGRGVQPQNLPRGTIEATDELVGRVLERGEGGTIPELSSLVRSVLKAPEGYVFVDIDYSSIENRVAAWIAGQNDKLELFKGGLDEYRVFAAEALYRVDYNDVSKNQRQVSKSAVLGCMFGQGAKGLKQYAAGMGVDLTEQESQKAVTAYRASYSKVKSCWYEMEAAAMSAIYEPGNVFSAGRCNFKVKDNNLWIQLPSGRLITWRDAKVEKKLAPWGELKDTITVRSQNTVTRQWVRNSLIGSSIFQSTVQASARDLIAETVARLYNETDLMINLLCHDEILCEVKEEEAESALEKISQIMCEAPAWAKGLPIAVEGWINKRYKK